jgi:hypothetical protein
VNIAKETLLQGVRRSVYVACRQKYNPRNLETAAYLKHGRKSRCKECGAAVYVSITGDRRANHKESEQQSLCSSKKDYYKECRQRYM